MDINHIGPQRIIFSAGRSYGDVLCVVAAAVVLNRGKLGHMSRSVELQLGFQDVDIIQVDCLASLVQRMVRWITGSQHAMMVTAILTSIMNPRGPSMPWQAWLSGAINRFSMNRASTLCRPIIHEAKGDARYHNLVCTLLRQASTITYGLFEGLLTSFGWSSARNGPQQSAGLAVARLNTFTAQFLSIPPNGNTMRASGQSVLK